MAKLTSMKAIRKKCLECRNGSFQEVTLCPIKHVLYIGNINGISRFVC